MYNDKMKRLQGIETYPGYWLWPSQVPKDLFIQWEIRLNSILHGQKFR